MSSKYGILSSRNRLILIIYIRTTRAIVLQKVHEMLEAINKNKKTTSIITWNRIIDRRFW